MNFQLRNVSALFRQRFKRQVVWLTDARRDLLGSPTTRSCLLIVVGREHYSERRKDYPIRSSRDLAQVLRHELSGIPGTIALIGREMDGGREVTFFELQKDVVGRLGRSLLWVPESFLVAARLRSGTVAVVDRDGFRYFLSDTGVSLPAGGAISDEARFALAIGLDEDCTKTTVNRDGVNGLIWDSLSSIRLSRWRQIVRPAIKLAPPIQWPRMAISAAVIVCAYMLASSAYLGAVEKRRLAELDALGPDLEMLLQMRSTISELMVQQHALAEVLNGKVYSYDLWKIVAAVWANGALIKDVSLSGEELTIKGIAPNATDVLAAVDEAWAASGARFTAPVRRDSSGGDSFSITLTLTGHGDD